MAKCSHHLVILYIKTHILSHSYATDSYLKLGSIQIPKTENKIDQTLILLDQSHNTKVVYIINGGFQTSNLQGISHTVFSKELSTFFSHFSHFLTIIYSSFKDGCHHTPNRLLPSSQDIHGSSIQNKSK